ncbi:MAG: TIGR03936 family radical SAM-associated protein [Clostridiales bacterium]|nr:TIGR03936 family radical SAM-associated protein [Clostridiales bacterium]
MASRMLILFSKKGRMKYIGHLDLLKVLQRAVSRSKIPISYSQGFNPHQQMSFALPLPIGVDGEREIVEIELEADLAPEDAVGALNPHMPRGMEILSARRRAEGEKTPASKVAAADYAVEADISPEELELRLEGALARKEMKILKKGKGGVKEIDIRPDLIEASACGNCLKLRLSAGSVKNIKAEDILSEMNLKPKSICRLELLKKTEDGFEPIF